MRHKAWIAVFIALVAALWWVEGGFTATGDDKAPVTVKVTLTAVVTANGHSAGGGSDATDDVKITLTETSVFRYQGGSHNVLSSQHHVAVEGKGKLVLGEDLPIPKWTYVPDDRSDNPYSSVYLGRDGGSGVLSLRNFTDTVEMNCELPREGLTAPYPIAPVIATQTYNDYALKNPIRDQQGSTMMIPFAFPPDSGARNISGQATHEFTEKLANLGKGKLIVSYTVTRDAPAADEEKTSKLKAVPIVSSTVQRGETVILDGTNSTGNVQEYTWNFKRNAAATGGDFPNEKAMKTGAKSSVILLDSMDVTLTVSDGSKIDKKTVTVIVTPRSYFRTHFEHVSQESYLPDSKPPSCLESGMNEKHKPTYDAGWIGAENVCAIDPPGSDSDEPPHIFHPDPAKASKDDLYLITAISDPDGPWDSFFYFKEWKTEIKRRTRINSYIVESGPPMLELWGMSFYDFNLLKNGDVKGYLKGVRAHEKKHSKLMAEALADNDPAKESEKAYGNDEQKLRDEAKSRIRDAAEKLHEHAKDPLRPPDWQGWLAVPVERQSRWVLIWQRVGDEEKK